jgi:TetR/AcrR family transcriptional regulator
MAFEDLRPSRGLSAISDAQRAPDTRAPVRRRNSARTKDTILKAATAEFCRRGFDGARVESISSRSKSNIRLLYQHFGDKTGLYVAVLEHVYAEIRSKERALRLDEFAPDEAMRRLIDFTFVFFATHRDYVALINNENLLRARHMRRSKLIRSLTIPLVTSIREILARGESEGVFRRGVDPVQLYISITAQSYFHVSNRHTLSAMFDKNLGSPEWLAERRRHAQDVLMTWLMRDAPAEDACGRGKRG